MRSDKCKKVGFDSVFVIFVAYASLLQWVVKIGARLCQSSAILVHSWGISLSILAHFTRCWGSLEPSRGCKLAPVGGQNWCTFVTQCWGSLEASRGGMLEVIGAVGWGLEQGYVEGFAAVMLLVSPNAGALLRLLVEVCWK